MTPRIQPGQLCMVVADPKQAPNDVSRHAVGHSVTAVEYVAPGTLVPWGHLGPFTILFPAWRCSGPGVEAMCARAPWFPPILAESMLRPITPPADDAADQDRVEPVVAEVA